MSLYDIINDISAQQATKTETGDNRIYGVMVGIVVKNYDEDMKGRLCVNIPTRDEGKSELKWARLAMPSSGKKWGHYFMPEIGDQVLLAFEGGNIERPYVIGCVPIDTNSFLTGSVDKNNQIKRIVTKNGSHITFRDGVDSKGNDDPASDQITIQTAGKTHTVMLDNQNKKILIKDKDKKNFIEMSTEENSGKMTIQLESSLTIKVGDTITMTLNGESGAIKIEASQMNIEASDQFKASSTGTMKLEGGQITANASSAFKAESGGPVTISGMPIKIG